MFAFEITKEDVKNSLESNFPDVESSDDTVNNLYEKLDYDAIEKSVMYETDFVEAPRPEGRGFLL